MGADDARGGGGPPDLPEGRITAEALDGLRRLTGLQMRPERYVREATIDTVANFCNGVGDLNPLHRDEEYAKWTRWGGVIAPGCFLYARTWPGRTRFGLPGVHGFHAGNDFRFERPVRLGDRIDSVERMLGFEEKESRFSGRLVIIHVETVFTNQRGERIATVRGWNTRHERAAAREHGKESREDSATGGGRAYEYGPEELYAIEQAQYTEDERIRGAETRYWEDVREGDELDPIARGPLTTSDVTAWLVGTGRGRAHGAALKEARRHPATTSAIRTPGRASNTQAWATSCARSPPGSACPGPTTSARSASPGRARWSRTGWATTASSCACAANCAAST